MLLNFCGLIDLQTSRYPSYHITVILHLAPDDPYERLRTLPFQNPLICALCFTRGARASKRWNMEFDSLSNISLTTSACARAQGFCCFPTDPHFWALCKHHPPCAAMVNPQSLRRKHKLRISEPFWGEFPMDLGSPPLKIKDLLEPNPLKSRFSVCGLTVVRKGSTRGQHTIK